MNGWFLPEFVEFGGREYTVNTDFRDVLEVISVLQDVDKHEAVRVLVALSLFYDDFESMPESEHQAAAEWMVKFIALGEEEDGMPQPKLIDWEQDRTIIAAEVNKVAGTEIRLLEHLHWWTFVSYFRSIGEGQLSYIVGIRDKRHRGKALEKHEREFYKKNRSIVDFKEKLSTVEQETLNKWLGK